VYPALAVAEALVKDYPQVKLYFVGSGGLERELVQESTVSFAAYDEVLAGPIAGVSWPRRVLSLVYYAVGTLQALLLMLRHRPQALLLTGGWSSLPVALTAWLRRVPILIYVPDIEPAASIRRLRSLARRVALTVEDSAQYFPNTETEVTGYPLRQVFTEADRKAGIVHFGLDPERPVLLVFGGSRGARSINCALLAVLPDLLAEGLQVIHVSGTLDWPEVAARRDALAHADYHAFHYLHHEMGQAQAAADLVVSRAGASTMAEFPYFGLASILVPYPYAWRTQKINADYLVERGAALRLDDERLQQDLLPTIRALIRSPERLAAMREQSSALARRDGASRLAANLAQLAGGTL